MKEQELAWQLGHELSISIGEGDGVHGWCGV